jgi:replicative DNA helicase
MSLQPQLNFDTNFLLGTFELMLLDQDFSLKCLNYLKPEYFKSEHLANLFVMFKKLHDKYDTVPTKNQIANEIAQIVDPKKSEEFNLIFKRITKPDSVRDHIYIKHNLEKFVKRCVSFQIHSQIQNGQSNDPDVVFEKIEKFVSDYQGVSFSKVKTESLTNIEYILERSQNNAVNLIPTFLPTIDLALGGGVPRSTLAVGLSGTNVGKSIWLINWAYHLCKAGYKVFYVNLEGYEEQPLIRLISRALQAPYYNVRHNRLTEYQKEQVLDIKNTWAKNFQYFHNSSFSFSIEDLVPILKSKKSEFNYDVIMVDYGQILTSKRKFDGMRQEQAFIHRSLATVAGEVDALMVTVAQGNREAQDKNAKASEMLRMVDISECFEIVRAAATVFTLNRSLKDQDADRVRILLDKQRDGATNVVEICKSSFARMCFYGHESEGLGFMNREQYIQESNSSK